MMEQTGIDYEGLIRLYFGEPEDTPFPDREAEWRCWSRFVDLLCAIRLMQKEADPPEDLDRIGCLLSDSALSLSLEPRETGRFPEWKRLRAVFSGLLKRSGEGDPEAMLPLGSLLSEGGLEPVEWMAFLLSLCVQKSRKYERVFGVLQEQAEGILMPTAGLVRDLCVLFMTEDEASPAILQDPDSFLNRFLLSPVRIPEGLSLLSKPLAVSTEAYAMVEGADPGLGEMAAYAEEFSRGEEADYICHEALLEELIETYVGSAGFGEGGIVFLEGEKGAGKSFLMEQLCAASGMNLMTVSFSSIAGGGRFDQDAVAAAIIRRCYFRKELLYFRDFPTEPQEIRAAVDFIRRIRTSVNLVFAGGKTCRKEAFPGDLKLHLLHVPDAGMKAQKQFWQLFREELDIVFEEDVDSAQLVSKYNLTPGMIRDTLLCSRLHGEITEEGVVVGQKLIEREIRAQSMQSFGECATKLEPAFTWADLQLSKESAEELMKAMNRVRYRSVVNDEYGFGKKLPYGNGVAVVLYGPPGTGKTMAAQVLARELGLDIYRIDLSQIESKYIGETEKNLGRIFAAAKYSNAILFFDEADALFAKRTDVKDSNDRHANAETAYLLQKIEEYSGVSILATNVFSNFDDAFKRRMTFLIPVRWPEEEDRLKLWKKIFPPETPLEEDIDFRYIAKIGEMPGSGIKNVAVAAAYRAAREKRPVSEGDILAALEDEYQKNGLTLGRSGAT